VSQQNYLGAQPHKHGRGFFDIRIKNHHAMVNERVYPCLILIKRTFFMRNTHVKYLLNIIL